MEFLRLRPGRAGAPGPALSHSALNNPALNDSILAS